MEVDEPSLSSQKRKRDCESEELIRTVGCVLDKKLLIMSEKHPRIRGRFCALFSLLEAYGLLNNFKLMASKPATVEELRDFHSSEYVEYLQEINKSFTPDDDMEFEFGIGYDCPPFDGLFDYCSAVGGSTITAARALVNRTVDIAVNWFGGWHHAQRDEAEGFCYVNDIALGILELRKSFENVIYFDLDIHHGNGVENAFSYTKRVMTVSFHLFESGFYPGTGTTNDIGFGPGNYHCVNVPLRSGTSDATYIAIFNWVLHNILRKFQPDAIVVQCGADGLSGDPIANGFNLSQEAYGHCVKELIKLHKPTLILGGGGYHIANTARCWTYVSSIIAGKSLSSDIPEHKNFCIYGSTFELPVAVSNRRDNNTPDYIENLKKLISKNLENI